MSLAPIVLFVFNRPDETRRTLQALKDNYLASKTDLYIFSDGARVSKELDSKKVEIVRDICTSIDGFKSTTLFNSESNQGLAKSVINGVTKVLEKEEKVIVLEDDLITTPNFLDFMNQALDFYADKKRFISISGHSISLNALTDYPLDYYLSYRSSSWGWGTWKDRWVNVDWNLDNNFYKIFSVRNFMSFIRGGSDLPFMLWKQKKAKIDSWAVRWCFHQSLNDFLAIYPKKSKIQNIGFTDEATHTKGAGNHKLNLDPGIQRDFSFEMNHRLDPVILSEFKEPYSLRRKMLNIFNRKK